MQNDYPEEFVIHQHNECARISGILQLLAWLNSTPQSRNIFSIERLQDSSNVRSAVETWAGDDGQILSIEKLETEVQSNILCDIKPVLLPNKRYQLSEKQLEKIEQEILRELSTLISSTVWKISTEWSVAGEEVLLMYVYERFDELYLIYLGLHDKTLSTRNWSSTLELNFELCKIAGMLEVFSWCQDLLGNVCFYSKAEQVPFIKDVHSSMLAWDKQRRIYDKTPSRQSKTSVVKLRAVNDWHSAMMTTVAHYGSYFSQSATQTIAIEFTSYLEDCLNPKCVFQFDDSYEFSYENTNYIVESERGLAIICFVIA